MNPPAFARNPVYRWYVVAMLWAVSFFNYADRQAVFSVFPLIQSEMHLSNLQLGLVGSAFAWVYGLSAPLAGILADRVRRSTAILWGLHVWSAICLATGFSRDFPHLLAFRAAEGLGESIYYPASTSLISDYHGSATRSRALGWHQTAIYAGTVAGGFFAGLIGQHYGWRWSFYVFGGLGILLGFALKKYLVEPERGQSEETVATAGAATYGGFLRNLFHTPAALLLMAAFVCMNFVAVILLAWIPKFLFDRYHLGLATAALAATLCAQLGSAFGSVLGGWLADRFRARATAGRVWVQALAALLAMPFVALSGLAAELGVCLAALALWGIFKGLYDANTWASLFDVVPPSERGRAAGLMNTAGWFGGGSAPLVIAYASETFGLGPAIAGGAAAYGLGFVLLVLAGMGFTRRTVNPPGPVVP